MIEISNDDVLIFDTCAYIDLYRFPLSISTRLLEIIQHYKSNIWVPFQVMKEIEKNKKAVSKQHYNKFHSSVNTKVDGLKDDLVGYLNAYFKIAHIDFEDIDKQLQPLFEQVKSRIVDNCMEIPQEKDKYKNHYESVEKLLDELFLRNVGEELSSPEIINIIRDSEIRVEYKIPPGFKDNKKDDKLAKYGDMIVWKEIIKYMSTSQKKRGYFITSDVSKNDIFESDKKTPKNELVREFNYCCKGKEIKIIPISEFIPDDPKLVIQLRRDFLAQEIEEILFCKTQIYLDDTAVYNDIIKKYAPISGTEIKNYCSLTRLIVNAIKTYCTIKFFDANTVVYDINAQFSFSTEVYERRPDFSVSSAFEFDASFNCVFYRKFIQSETDFLNYIKSSYNISEICIKRNEYIVYDADTDGYYDMLESLENNATQD